MSTKKLFLIDAYALIFRAFYSMGKNFLYNSKDFNVTAVMGFTRTLHTLISKEQPSHLAVVFDFKGQTFRSKEFAYYKANREETPEDIKLSEPIIREIIKAYQIPILEKEGFEADDVIGTIAKQKAKEGFEVYMVTPDKDFAQLVDDHIFIWKPGRKGDSHEIIGVNEVKESWRVDDPAQVIDVLALWGDSVDNIPGVPGIGKKTAPTLVTKYGSVEGLLRNVQQLKGKLKENVENNRQQALDSKRLATIITDVPIEVSNEDLIITTKDEEKLIELFTELEFRTLGKQILGQNFSVNTAANTGQLDLFSSSNQNKTSTLVTEEVGNTIETIPHQYHLVNTVEAVEELVSLLSKQQTITFDTETTGLNDLACELVGISFAIKPHEAYYVPANKTFIALLQPVFENEEIEKIGQNIKFDLNVLSQYQIKVKGKLFDTMVAHYVLEPDKRHNMDYLAESLLGYSPISIETLIGKKGKNQKSIADIPLPVVTDYAAEDADITQQLKNKLQHAIDSTNQNKAVFYDIEMPLLPILANMEQEGVALDIAFLNQYSKELTEEINNLQDSIFGMAGTSFNLDSPKQMGEILFDHLQIPYKGKKTATGQYSTSESKLSQLSDQHDIIAQILDYRQIAKLKSTYVDALPELINPRTGRLHTTFQQAVAATGRLSSTNPNLQNIPIRTERGRKVRQAFIPRNSSHKLLAVDYSQIELRLVAHLSGDETMIEAFNSGADIHKLTAAKVFNVSEHEVTREMRSTAKTVNFGIIYGVTPWGLSQQSNLSKTEAKEMIDTYFQTYPQLKTYMDGCIQFARDHGYVETISGRRRYLLDINSRNQTVRGHAERNAINAPVQGSAADLIKIAMIKIHRALLPFSTVMTLQVHDELLFDVPEEELETVKQIIIEQMETAIPNLNVAIIAEAGVGNNWLEAH